MIDKADAARETAGAPNHGEDNFANERAWLSNKNEPAKTDLSPTLTGGLGQLDILFQKVDQYEKQNEVSRASDKPFQRYETENILDAVKAAQTQGLPLVVQIGASWCPHCQAMEKLWPNIEGSATSTGSMQGKAVFLHLDVDKAKKLTGPNAGLAQMIQEGVRGFPTFKVFSIDNKNMITVNAFAVGEMSQSQLEAVIIKGGAKK